MPRSRMMTQESGALRRRVAHLIDTVTFDPPGMPPSSILLVRRLSDPLPGRLASHLEAVRADSEWESAARSKLSEFHRRAARPIHGFVPGSADAVMFTDQSELLACLARDIVHGNAAMLWWWRAILRNLPAGMMEALIAAWRRDARYVPAALHLLHASGEAVRLLIRFSPAQAWSILEEIAREFAISLPSPGGAPFIHVRQEAAPAAFEEDREQSAQPVEEGSGPGIAAPWHELTFIPAVPDSLGRERSALLGVSLLLHCAPQTTRAARFSERFSAWYHHVGTQRIQPEPTTLPAATLPASNLAASAPIAISPLTSSEMQDAAIQRTTNASFGEQPRFASAESKPDGPGSLEPAGDSEDAKEQEMANEAVLCDHETRVTAATERLAHENLQAQRIIWITKEEGPAASALEAGPPSELDAVPSAAEFQTPQHVSRLHTVEGEAVPTELGGVLFLVNLLRALKLPELLETEFGVGPVSGWDLLELLARSLLGHRERGLAGDGIWTVIAQLAGRSADDPIAAEFQPQPSYRIPSFWMDALRPQAAQVFGVRLRNTRLQLWHQQGFMLADCLGDRMFSHVAIQEECRIYRQKDELPSLSSWREILKPSLAGCGNAFVKSRALRRFLAFLLPYVRWRLCLALGLTNAYGLPEALLLRRGYLHTTRTHLDQTMNLNQATAQVRMAGLDADPGWMPRLGRVIKFSFVTAEDRG